MSLVFFPLILTDWKLDSTCTICPILNTLGWHVMTLLTLWVCVSSSIHCDRSRVTHILSPCRNLLFLKYLTTLSSVCTYLLPAAFLRCECGSTVDMECLTCSVSSVIDFGVRYLLENLMQVMPSTSYSSMPWNFSGGTSAMNVSLTFRIASSTSSNPCSPRPVMAIRWPTDEGYLVML